MPESQLQPMTEQQVRDLFKYLMSPVPGSASQHDGGSLRAMNFRSIPRVCRTLVLLRHPWAGSAIRGSSIPHESQSRPTDRSDRGQLG